MLDTAPTEAQKLFLKFDYPETKDLAKAFLTLSATILTFSVTFSEKIVDFKSARFSAKLAISLSWLLNVLAIALCGLAIVFLSLAGGFAVYGYSADYDWYALVCYVLMLVAGTAFVAALAALATSAIISLIAGPKPGSAATVAKPDDDEPDEPEVAEPEEAEKPEAEKGDPEAVAP